jgi:transcriptional antiterminator NusG
VEAGEGAASGPQTADDAAGAAESVEQAAAEQAAVDETSSDETAVDAEVEPEEIAEARDDVPPENGEARGDVADAVDTVAGAVDEDDDAVDDVEPLEVESEADPEEELRPQWYILKVQVNREESIRDALLRRVKIEGLERFFGDIVVPTEDVAEFTKTGKRRIVKRKLYPGYIMVNMTINDDTWFLVRETPGIGDFTGSAGKPTPMDTGEVERILNLGGDEDAGESQVKTAIPFKTGDRVRVKEGYFQNFEGDVESVDEANGRVTVMINIFGRSTPVELEHWQIEAV